MSLSLTAIDGDVEADIVSAELGSELLVDRECEYGSVVASDGVTMPYERQILSVLRWN